MSFYLIPPTGVVGIDLLYQWTLKRANFLRNVYSCNNSFMALKSFVEQESAAKEYADCLIEGSAKDVISHFTLRLACSGDKSARDIVISSESALFRYRLQTLNKSQFLKFLNHFHRLRQHFLTVTMSQHCRDFCLNEIMLFLTNVGSSVNWSELVDCYKSCCDGCKQCILKIPFRFVTTLVAERRSELHHGNVSVSSNHLLDLLVAVFEAWFEFGLRQAVVWRSKVIVEDDRLKLIFNKCKNALKGYDCSINRVPSNVLRGCHVDEAARHFPPCMSHLHSKLRSNHRLKHMSRVTYTLFLKSLGMPLQEAIDFWRNEYSQTAANGYRGCQHSWHGDNKRYIYSLRHLYGQEGRRADYQSFTCRHIQNQEWGTNEEGGCPFKHSNLSSLQQALQCKKLSTWSDIQSLVSNESYTAACHTYLDELINIQNNCDESSYTATSSPDDKADSGYDSLQSEITQEDAHCFVTRPTAAHVTLTVNQSPPPFFGGVKMTSTTKCCHKSRVNRPTLVRTVDGPRPPKEIDMIASHRSRGAPCASFASPVDYTFTYQQLLRDLHSVTVSTSIK